MSAAPEATYSRDSHYAVCANCGDGIAWIPEEAEWIHEATLTRRCRQLYALPEESVTS